MGELGVIVEGGCQFFGEGSIRAKESLIFLLVCLCVEVSLRAMRPTGSYAKLTGGGCWT